MRIAFWIVLLLAGALVLTVAGFLGYLNWAFSPRGAPRGKPADTRSAVRTGEAGAGLFFLISTLRTAGSADVIYDVTLASTAGAARRNEGDTVVRTVNAPVPVNVTRPEPRTVLIEFDRPIDAVGSTSLRVSIGPNGEIPAGWYYFENGVAKMP